jgi:hypothetical protein
MASERRIAANRRKARNSTGPRTTSGKKRACQNAFRHGLTKRISGAEFDREVETLARQIAGDTDDKITIELAHDAAEGELELARVRRVKAASSNAWPHLDDSMSLNSFKHPRMRPWIMLRYFGATLWKGRPKFAVDPLPAMPPQQPRRTAEAVRRILPELIRLHRYEFRAVVRRDRAIRAIALRGKNS